MKYYAELSGGHVVIDFQQAVVHALECGGQNILATPAPLFTVALRTRDGQLNCVKATDACQYVVKENTVTYSCFPEVNIGVTIRLCADKEALTFGIEISNYTDALIEWIDCPVVDLKPLKKNGGVGELLFPYNEGALVDDLNKRPSWLSPRNIEYPSMGSFCIFPNMLCSQFMAYLCEGHGLYMGAHDPTRGVKGLDYTPVDGNTRLHMRLYCGVDFGESWTCPFPIVWKFFKGSWEDAADIYRAWFEANLPRNAKKIADNDALPDWYADAPLVVTYPVRGIHDMDKMDPNALFPYMNALPRIEDIANRVKSRLLVLLMHWEGTAPWAPPYVWPPYGGEEGFNAFKDALHDQGHLLGVYCSGFGYTLQSNLNDYNMEKECAERGLEAGMCAGPDGKVAISRICTGQRKGYDICPASPDGREILKEAYMPLFESGVDYSQILDQNHGGGQYFCYSAEHGHAPAPGPWMTENMQELLTDWNGVAGKMLLGCESAAAEPFIGNLLFSDNRFELSWLFGRPVPLYAYVYHEYLRNFMGNQVCCPFPETLDTLRHRMAYSFAAGDCMTVALMPDGGLYPNWGGRNFSNPPDYDKAMTFAANMQAFYAEKAKPYLYNGRMVKPCSFTVTSAPHYDDARATFPPVFSTAWEQNGKRVQIFVNANEVPVTLNVNGNELTVPASDAVMIKI